MGPGMLLKIPRLFFLPNLFALLFLCWSAKTHLRTHWSLTIAASLCFPVVLYGFASSMQDFFVNACAAAAAISIFSHRLDTAAADYRQTLIPGFFMLALAANTKFQGLILAALILILGAVFILIQARRNRRLAVENASAPFRKERPFRFSSRMLLPILLVCLIFFQPALNLIRFSNPVYPVKALFFAGPERSYTTNLPYVPKIPLLYNGLSFFASSSELDPILRSKEGLFFPRNVHMINKPASDDIPPDTFGNRWIVTGGSNGILYLGILALAVLSIVKDSKSDPGPTGLAGDRLILRRKLMISCLVGVLVPQSLELRYYMYLLIIPSLVAVSSTSTPYRSLARAAVASGLIYVIVASMLPSAYYLLRTSQWLPDQAIPNPLAQPPSQAFCKAASDAYASEKLVGSVEIPTVKHTILCGF